MILYSLVAALLCSTAQSQPRTTDVRVAIVAYEDFRGEVDQYKRLFGELTRRDPSFRFQLSVGTYGDVLHWLDRQAVDVAILTPGVFAGLVAPQASSSYKYLATVQLPAARSIWASGGRRAVGFHETYRPICLVSESSGLKTIDDVRRLIKKNQIEFLFVHPYSISGHVTPQKALRAIGVDVESLPSRFTYSHSQSIRMLRERAEGRHRVAFVWDDATGNDPGLEEGIRRCQFPELEQLEIPHDVIVACHDYEPAERLRELLMTELDSEQRYRFVYLDDWETRYRSVTKWLEATGAVLIDREEQTASLNEIGQLLLQCSRSQPQPPRLALVLSGGGAKCSYQIGAVAALEEELAEIRRENPDHQLDIALVVGTSGGAINSLPVAMGISKTEEGRRALRRTWHELDQREIVRPSLLIRINMGLWFALLQTAFVIWIVKLFVRDRQKRGWPFAIVFTVLAGIETLVGYLSFSPWSWLGQNHITHHVWLWLSFGVRTSAWCLLIIGIAAIIRAAIKRRKGRQITIPETWIKKGLLVGMLGLPLLQMVTILTIEETLSGGEGMEDTLAHKYSRLINRHLDLQHQLPLGVEDADNSGDILKSVSRQIMERRLLARDLVITGSCLDHTSQELPSDLYFFAAANQAVAPPDFGKRGVSLVERPDILLDVIMGSGSIYPVFPARTIEGIPQTGEKIELIDGGFAHNSPIEAAVMWGATHIVLIDVVPRGRMKRGNFLLNATSSFRHLHRQAQLIDSRSRGKVTIFTLSPEPPHLCVIDFADNLIDASIKQGYQDAVMDAPLGTPRFRKEFGEPVFVDVLPTGE